MPKRTDIKSILIIGAGPIVIGQACEFDYSGAQACKALREEGYRVILVNSNPATIMTDNVTADHIYLLPLEVESIRQILQEQKIDAVLHTEPLGRRQNFHGKWKVCLLESDGRAGRYRLQYYSY